MVLVTPSTPRSRRFVATLLLSAITYVAAGSFVDLPPQGIALESTRSDIMAANETAHVRVSLTYVCTSWRTRRTSVYLPFAHAHGEGEAQNLTGTDLADCTVYADGVILALTMPAGTRKNVEFEFEQATPRRQFEYLFGVPRGWTHPPNLIETTVETPDNARLRTSAAGGDVRRAERAGWTRTTLVPEEGQGVLLQWD